MPGAHMMICFHTSPGCCAAMKPYMSLNTVIGLFRQWFYLIKFVTFFRFNISVLSQHTSSIESTAPVFAATPLRVLDFIKLASAIQYPAPSSEVCNDLGPDWICFIICF